jgi:hypothetical protein
MVNPKTASRALCWYNKTKSNKQAKFNPETRTRRRKNPTSEGKKKRKPKPKAPHAATQTSSSHT